LNTTQYGGGTLYGEQARIRHRRDLHESIVSGAYPEWELGLQMFDQEFVFAETEQVAFCPANNVSGVDFSDDELSARRADADERAHRSC
jgi:catalase